MRLRQLALFLVTIMQASNLESQAAPGKDWLYISGLQQGDLAVFDSNGRPVHSIAVHDGDGIIGVSVSSNGKTVYVADDGRLRVFDAKTATATHELRYDGALRLLGGGPIMHLSADDKALLIKTYDYGAAAAGVRIFNAAAGAFASLGLRSRACPAPDFASAKEGTVVAICPETVQALKEAPHVPGDIPEVARAPYPLADIAGAAMTADGRHLYVIESVQADGSWKLATWERGSDRMQTIDLRQTLTLPEGAGRNSQQAWLALSPDDRFLALLEGARVSILDRDTLKLVHQLDLPHDGNNLAFSSDSQELLTLDDQAQELVRIPVHGGNLARLPLPGLHPSRGPKAMCIAPAP
jgi:WD40 repeat protein